MYLLFFVLSFFWCVCVFMCFFFVFGCGLYVFCVLCVSGVMSVLFVSVICLLVLCAWVVCLNVYCMCLGVFVCFVHVWLVYACVCFCC